MTTTDRRQTSPEYNLEIGTDSPRAVRLIIRELEEAETPMKWYLDRNRRALEMWQARWDGQSDDGRKHGPDAFPFDGGSDTRIRTIEEVIRDHVTVQRFAWAKAKIQAETTRTFAPAMSRVSNLVTKVLKWQLRSPMRAELLREIPLALTWRNGYGAAFLSVNWFQSRRLEFHELSPAVLADLFAFQNPAERTPMAEIQDALSNPAKFDGLVQWVMELVPLLTLTKARKAVEEIQTVQTTQVPIVRIGRVAAELDGAPARGGRAFAGPDWATSSRNRGSRLTNGWARPTFTIGSRPITTANAL
jgi:hypothetical protein